MNYIRIMRRFIFSKHQEAESTNYLSKNYKQKKLTGKNVSKLTKSKMAAMKYWNLRAG